MEKNKGITLIALVVTIIVLLILAGVTLSFVAGENGILKRATEAVDINEKATAEEEANLVVVDLASQYYEEKYVNHKEVEELDEYLKTELKTGKETATGNYIVIADTAGKIEVLKVDQVISTGKIENGRIEWSEDEIEDGKPDMIDKPRIKISNNVGTAVTVSVENKYPQEANVTYTYYLGTTPKASNISEKSFTIDGLLEETEYELKVVVTWNGNILESDTVKITTIGTLTPPKTTMISLEENSEKIALEYPILTLDGVMNSMVKCTVGDKVRIEIDNVAGITNYYSIDGGESWIEYTKTVELSYPGDGLLKAKSENSRGVSDIKNILPYSYAEELNCTGPTSGGNPVLAKEAYDRDYSTFVNCDTNISTRFRMDVDSECWGKYVTLYTWLKDSTNTNAGRIYFYEKEGNVLNQYVSGYPMSHLMIHTLSGESILNQTAKSIKIPKDTSWIGLHDGSSTVINFHVYEIWCSQENLNGKTY